jgi:TolB-like protein/Tfp pilus assembly protein PilF
MKQCPDCKRVYNDDSFDFCLDDGAALIYGPAEPPTAIFSSKEQAAGDDITRSFEAAKPTDSKRAVSTIPEATSRNVFSRTSSLAILLGIILVAGVAIGGYWFFRERPSKQINSLAVMPFSNDSGTPDAEYLSDGITDTLINSLSKIPGLNVKARSSVYRYKGQNVEPATVGKDLSVKAILIGRVVQRGDGLSIYLSLVDTDTGDQIWGEDYDRKLSDIVAVQKEITQDVSQKLQLRLSGADVLRATKNYTNDPEAYQLYLRGRHQVLKATPPEIESGIKYFQQAIDRDPSYALAYVGLADAYRAPGLERLPSEALSKSKAAVQKALEIDDSLADAHAVLGFIIFWYEWNWAAAEAELTRAIELDPKNADAHLFYAHLLSNTGRHEQALNEAKLARELDPLNVRTNALEGQFLMHAGHLDEGLARLKATIELDPNNWMAHLFSTSAYIEKGMFDDAISEGRKTIEIAPLTRSFSFLGYALAKAGRMREANEGLQKVLEASRERWVSPYTIALLYNGLEDRDQTIKWLEKGLVDHDPRMVFLKVEPKWNNLRSDPQFIEIARKAGFSD